MIFHPQNLDKKEGSFIFSGEVRATAHSCLNTDIVREFWKNFSYKGSTLSITESDHLIFSVGNVQPLPLEDSDYSIRVEAAGIYVSGKSEADLIRGLMTLIDRFEMVDRDETFDIKVECFELRESPIIPTRMVHFCVFPETELFELRRFVRFCGALKYTHIVLEFWGMLKYDCLRELSWSHGFTKEQIRPIIKEAEELGMEVIPMFNHWGHASAGRIIHGKHVVLDQNLSLQSYFREDGWCWDIGKPKVRALLRKIRQELMELCGKGSYFHIGCDEAFGFEFTRENMDGVCDFINEIGKELSSEGRRAIVWGDMFLYRYPHYNQKNEYACNAPTAEAEKYMLDRLSHELVIADWEYDVVEAPVETVDVFVREGFDCLLCPWDRGAAEMNNVLSAIKSQHLMGILHTTWHTLTKGMQYVTRAAVGGYEDDDNLAGLKLRTCTAALLRKVMPVEGDYEKAGWSKIQVHSLW